MPIGYTDDYILNMKTSNRMLRQRIKFLEAKVKVLEEKVYKYSRNKFQYDYLKLPKHKSKCNHIFKKNKSGSSICIRCKYKKNDKQ